MFHTNHRLISFDDIPFFWLLPDPQDNIRGLAKITSVEVMTFQQERTSCVKVKGTHDGRKLLSMDMPRVGLSSYENVLKTIGPVFSGACVQTLKLDQDDTQMSMDDWRLLYRGFPELVSLFVRTSSCPKTECFLLSALGQAGFQGEDRLQRRAARAAASYTTCGTCGYP